MEWGLPEEQPDQRDEAKYLLGIQDDDNNDDDNNDDDNNDDSEQLI